MIRRLLDAFHIASYPAHPRIARREDFAAGINVHADGSSFEQIKAAGFDTVLVDWSPEWEQITFRDLLTDARGRWRLRTFVTGFPKDGGPIVEQARELFSTHGDKLDFAAIRNEPDLWDYFEGTPQEYVEEARAVWAEKQVRASHVKLVGPCLSALGSSAKKGWQDKEEVIGDLGRLGLPNFVQITGQHIYQRTPDAVMRYYQKARKWYRHAGFGQPMFVSEFGWRSPKHPQERQARYIANTIAMLSREPDVVGAAVYVCNDDMAAKDFFGIRGKKAWSRVAEVLHG